MNTVKKIASSVLALFVAILSFAKDGNSDVTKLIESGNYSIVVDKIFPSGAPMISSTDGYKLTLSDGKVNAQLPYFGEAHTSIVPGVDEPSISFEDCEVSLKAVKGSGDWNWKFSAKSGNENVDVVITIWKNGSAEIACTPANRTFISYRGEVTE